MSTIAGGGTQRIALVKVVKAHIDNPRGVWLLARGAAGGLRNLPMAAPRRQRRVCQGRSGSAWRMAIVSSGAEPLRRIRSIQALNDRRSVSFR